MAAYRQTLLIVGCILTVACSRQETPPTTAPTTAAPGPSAALPSDWLGDVAQTRGELGIRLAGKEFCALGISADNLERRIGVHESGGPNAFLNFNQRGLKVQLDKDRRVIGYVFYLQGKSSEGGFAPANVATDTGITADSSADEIIAKCGKPLEDSTSGGVFERTLVYPWGEVSFAKGRIDRLRVAETTR